MRSVASMMPCDRHRRLQGARHRGSGRGRQGRCRALDYLTASNRKSFGDGRAGVRLGELNAAGQARRGGDRRWRHGDGLRAHGDPAGADSVKCLYRRDRANMPGSQREVQNAEEEGVVFVWLTAPKGFTGGTEVDWRDGAADASGRAGCTGRQSPELIEGADYISNRPIWWCRRWGLNRKAIPTLWGVPELAVTAGARSRPISAHHATSLLPVSMPQVTSCAAHLWLSGPYGMGAKRPMPSWPTSSRPRSSRQSEFREPTGPLHRDGRRSIQHPRCRAAGRFWRKDTHARIADCLAVVTAAPAAAGSFSPPEGCTTFMTVQSRQCRVVEPLQVQRGPAGDQWPRGF